MQLKDVVFPSVSPSWNEKVDFDDTFEYQFTFDRIFVNPSLLFHWIKNLYSVKFAFTENQYITYNVDLVVSTFVTLIWARSKTSSTFAVAWYTKLSIGIREMIRGTLVFALFTPLILCTFLAHVLVETVSRALLAARVTFATNSLACKWFQWSLLLRTHPLVVIPFNRKISVKLLNLITFFHVKMFSRHMYSKLNNYVAKGVSISILSNSDVGKS